MIPTIPNPIRIHRRLRPEWLFAGAALAAILLWPRRTSDRGQSVVITGGSRGLGFAFAAELLKRGACVTLLARDERELAEARRKLRLRSSNCGSLHTIRCDVTDSAELEQAFAETLEHFKKIDLIINNAGTIVVGPIGTMTEEDFVAQMKLHVRAPLESMRLLRPYFKKRGRGRIINISSIGGKIPVPHMATYCATKFALAGVSEVAATELKRDGIVVTTAYPGLMRTGSTIQAVMKGSQQQEYLWFAMSATMPLLSVSAERAARQILEASANGRHQVIVGWSAKLGVLVQAIFPETFARVMNLAARLQPTSGRSDRALGAASRGLFASVLDLPLLSWLKNVERASRDDHNQTPHTSAEAALGVSGTGSPTPSLPIQGAIPGVGL